MRRLFPAIFLVCFAVRFSALMAVPPKQEPGPATSAELAAGQALAEQLRSARPEENSQFHGRLIIKSEGAPREIPIVCQVRLNPTNWETDYETAATNQTGAERLVVFHSTNGPNQYLYARAGSPSAALPKPAPVPAADAVIPLAGSDFSLADLGLEFLHWPVQRQMKGEMRLGQPCYVLDSSNPQAREIVRVKSDIDKDSGGLLVAEAYDAQGRVVKEFSLHNSSFKKVHGRWQVQKMDIRNKKTGSRTELKFDLNE
jgi:hypothetical protein